ncbi:hypothetical protein HMSSN036_83040 [Paenibacillus macerans]|nr:hypothetical protein HMSSN036_83040 [Paenibacillus macerans]
MGKVTVVITLYNKERYIDQAIGSVLRQTYSDWELLIIDDASTDGSVAKARQFRDPRIRIVPLAENLGQCHVLNYALTMITSPYFMQLDADDWLDKETLRIMVEAAEANPHAALFTAIISLIGWITRNASSGRNRSSLNNIKTAMT